LINHQTKIPARGPSNNSVVKIQHMFSLLY